MPTSKNIMKHTPKEPAYTRLSFHDRLDIQAMLSSGESFTAIARTLEVSPSTVSREVFRNRISDSSVNWAGRPNVCQIKRDCSHKGLCGRCTERLCKGCKQGCRAYCPDYVKPTCLTLQGAPWTCNACPPEKRRQCRVKRYFYDAKAAQATSETRGCEARSGIDLTYDELSALNALISPLIKQGQSLEQVYLTHGDEIPVTVRTLYTYVELGAIEGICNLDLNSKVQRRSVKTKKRNKQSKAPLGRTYADFSALPVYEQMAATELDTVVGRVGGKALLTMYVRRFEFMFAFLIEDETHSEVMDHLSILAIMIGLHTGSEPVLCEGLDITSRDRDFGDFFQTLLTDNAPCFIGFADIEELGGLAEDGTNKTTLYYCDPYSAYQKGGLERGHRYIREVLPKGTSFDHLTEGDVSLLVSHINSIPRPKLGGKTPYELAAAWLGKDVFGSLGIVLIAPDDVIRKPWLLPAPPNKRK
jgi:IS30 family transposase